MINTDFVSIYKLDTVNKLIENPLFTNPKDYKSMTFCLLILPDKIKNNIITKVNEKSYN